MASAYTRFIDGTRSIFIARHIMQSDKYADVVAKVEKDKGAVAILFSSEEKFAKYKGSGYGRERKEEFIFRDNEFNGVLYVFVPNYWWY